MSCTSAENLLEAYLDNELDAIQKAEVAAHLESCPSCATSIDRLSKLSAAIRQPALYYQVPPYLEARVLAALREDVRPEVRQRSAFWNWAALAACLVLAAALSWTFLSLRARNSNREIVAQQVVSSHIRSLLGSHLLDVPSTDQHTVKPWFAGKLDFAPDVKDLAGQGFRLIGGRLDYVDGRPVAALVFQHRLHMVNLFVWPSPQDAAKPESIPTRNGYNVVHWNANRMTYWAVADIPVAELEQFAQLYRK